VYIRRKGEPEKSKKTFLPQARHRVHLSVRSPIRTRVSARAATKSVRV